MFWIKEKFVSLHRKTEMKCSIGLWCNGNTTDSGPVIPGSNPGSPTTHQQKPTKIASFSGFCCFSTMCKFFIIGIRVQFENSVVESVVVSKQEYQRVRFDTTTFYMLIIIRLSHLLPALAFLDFADRQSAYPSPCLCFSLFVQHRASGLLPLFLHCRKCRA